MKFKKISKIPYKIFIRIKSASSKYFNLLINLALSGFGLMHIRHNPQIYNYLYGFNDAKYVFRIGKNLIFKQSYLKKISSKIASENEPNSIEHSRLQKSKKIHWNLNDDATIRFSAQDFREVVLSPILNSYLCDKSNCISSISEGRSYWRVETMRLINDARPDLFLGTVLEVGAGTGIVSSMLSKLDSIDSVECSDYDEYSVDMVMPVYQWALNANIEKITRAVGSYNNIKSADNSYNAIVAVGALHHSENLLRTMRECFRVLKPGGSFVISDYALSNTLTQAEYNVMMDKPRDEQDAAKFEDTEVLDNIKTNRDISEHGRPICLYQSAAFQAGFDVDTYIFDANSNAGETGARLLRKMKAIKNVYLEKSYVDRELGYDPFGNVKSFSMNNIVNYPYYASDVPTLIDLIINGDKAGKPVYDNMVLILKKPEIAGQKVAYRYSSGNMYRFPVKNNSVRNVK